MTEMPINDRYIAKESLTPLLVSVVMFVLGLYAAINTSKIWCVIRSEERRVGKECRL